MSFAGMLSPCCCQEKTSGPPEAEGDIGGSGAASCLVAGHAGSRVHHRQHHMLELNAGFPPHAPGSHAAIPTSATCSVLQMCWAGCWGFKEALQGQPLLLNSLHWGKHLVLGPPNWRRSFTHLYMTRIWERGLRKATSCPGCPAPGGGSAGEEQVSLEMTSLDF